MLLVAPVLLLLWKVEMTALYGMPKFLETSTLCVKKKLRSHSPQAVDLHPEEKAVYMHCHCFGQFHETSSWKKHFYLFIYLFLHFFPRRVPWIFLFWSSALPSQRALSSQVWALHTFSFWGYEIIFRILCRGVQQYGTEPLTAHTGVFTLGWWSTSQHFCWHMQTDWLTSVSCCTCTSRDSWHLHQCY